MKLKTLSVAVILLSCIQLQAQKIHIGIKGGANINKLSTSSLNDKFSFGYHAGAFAEIGIGKKIAIQPEVLFSQTKLDTTSKFSSIYTINKVPDIQLTYISIPIFLNVKLSKFFAIQAGPQYGILLDKNKTVLLNGKNAFTSGDFSLLGGVQISLASFRFYGRYAVGLSNVHDISSSDKWKSQSIQIGVGLAIL
jgi:hypothetical protein